MLSKKTFVKKLLRIGVGSLAPLINHFCLSCYRNKNHELGSRDTKDG